MVVAETFRTFALDEELARWFMTPPLATMSVGMVITPVPDCVNVPEPPLPTVRLESPAENVAEEDCVKVALGPTVASVTTPIAPLFVTSMPVNEKVAVGG